MLKSYTHQREATVSSNDSLQLRPFSKWELLLKERICFHRERILSFNSSSLRYGKSPLPHKVSSLECYYFTIFIKHMRILRMGATPVVNNTGADQTRQKRFCSFYATKSEFSHAHDKAQSIHR